ncbi:MAG: hypothetical protein R3F56_00050 [Planctomycetota bacterium]
MQEQPRGITWPALPADAACDELDEDAVWSAGDLVHYRIEATTGQTPRTWSLEISLPELPEPLREPQFADTVSGFLRVANAHNQVLTDSSGRSLTRYSRAPVVLRVRLTCDQSGEAIATDVATVAEAHVWQETVDTRPEFGIHFLFHSLLRVDRLLGELVAIVRPPSAWSVIGNGMRVGVRLELHADLRSPVVEVATPLGLVPAFWLPGTLYANEQRALDCRFLITWRRSPLLPSLGVLRIEGHHPDDDGKRVLATVVAARRGRYAAPDRDDLGMGLRKGITEAEFVAALGGRRDTVYRVPGADGATVDLVFVDCPAPLGRLVGAFQSGRLSFCNSPGRVGRFLERRGFAPGPYRSEFVVEPRSPDQDR